MQHAHSIRHVHSMHLWLLQSTVQVGTIAPGEGKSIQQTMSAVNLQLVLYNAPGPVCLFQLQHAAVSEYST